MRTIYIIANNISPYTGKTYNTFAEARAALSGDRFSYIRPYCKICETTQELVNSYYDEFCRDPDLYSDDEDAHMELFNRSFTVVRW